MGSSTGVADAGGDSTSPKQSRIPSPHRPVKPESKHDAPKHDAAPATTTATTSALSNSEATKQTTKPLAPPPRPVQPQPSGNTPDLFAFSVGGHLNLEPNPFEQSFSGAPETPGGTKLPPVASITSPSSLLPGGGTTPFPWGSNSLRTGPLSPAMLSGPTGSDYFSNDHHIRNGFPTPNESSLRTGLTPGGSGSMFPAPSPNSQVLYAQLGSGPTPTPGALEFHRAALSASAAKREQESRAQAQAQAQQAVTSQPQPLPHETKSNGGPPMKNDTKPSTGPFDPHDNDAANGLYMLARGQNGGAVPPTQQYNNNPQPPIHPQSLPHPHAHPHPGPQAPSTSPQMNGNASITGSSARGVSEALSALSDDSEQPRPNTRGKNKRNPAGGQANSRRKAEDSAGKGPATKKSKSNGGMPSFDSFDMDDHSDIEDDMKINKDGTKTKMTEEEKRKNFLERNRVAALKCRQRKKAWLASLQTKVELYSSENETLTTQITQLREEVVNLKTLLLAHKDCPVTQSQGMHTSFLQQGSMEFAPNPPINAYMGGPMQGQAVLANNGIGRRFS
ncbi:transcription factor atf1 [Podospora conica]|nr:transcription factor atf1 [Schizothecium conicum]